MHLSCTWAFLPNAALQTGTPHQKKSAKPGGGRRDSAALTVLISLSELALRFCFDYPRVASTLVGMSKIEHVRNNLRAHAALVDPEIVR